MLSAAGTDQYGTRIRQSVALFEQEDHALEQRKQAKVSRK